MQILYVAKSMVLACQGRMYMATIAAYARATGRLRTRAASLMVIVAGLALIVYGLLFVWRNVTSFIELGLTPAHVGATPHQIRDFSPRLYNYLSHHGGVPSGCLPNE